MEASLRSLEPWKSLWVPPGAYLMCCDSPLHYCVVKKTALKDAQGKATCYTFASALSRHPSFSCWVLRAPAHLATSAANVLLDFAVAETFRQLRCYKEMRREKAQRIRYGAEMRAFGRFFYIHVNFSCEEGCKEVQ